MLHSRGTLLQMDNFLRVLPGHPDHSEHGAGHKTNVQPLALITPSARFSYGGYHIRSGYGNVVHCIAERVFS